MVLVEGLHSVELCSDTPEKLHLELARAIGVAPKASTRIKLRPSACDGGSLHLPWWWPGPSEL